MARIQQVVIGPRVCLHTGIHGALLQCPPSGVDYIVKDATHSFVLPSLSDTLFTAQAALECVDFGEEHRVVHSAFWPVLNARHWTTETDDFGVHVFCSLYAYNPDFIAREARRATRSDRFARQVAVRLENMLTAFAHESCKGILVNTAHERRRTFAYLRDCGDPRLGDAVAKKVDVLYPAAISRPIHVVEGKWARSGPLTIAFCGRGFEEKRGAVALRAMARVLDEVAGTICIYIGDIPENVRTEHRQVLARIRHYPLLRRDEVLARFDEAHVLLHPGISESVGAVFIEAAAAGMAVITARGFGYEHIHEWFESGGAVLVDRDTVPPTEEEHAFTSALLSLAGNPTAARAHGLHSYRVATEGCLSIKRRDEVLASVYALGESDRGQPLTLANFARNPGDHLLQLSSAEMVDARRSYRASIGRPSGSLEIPYEV